MALQIDVQRFGVTIPNTYVKIRHYSGNKRNFSIHVAWYPTREDADNGINKMGEKHFHYAFEDDMGVNPLAAGYSRLKLEPEFAGAVDV